MLSHDLDRAAAYAGRAGGVLAGLLTSLLAIFVRALSGSPVPPHARARLRGRHDLIRLDLKPPTTTLPAQLEGLKYEH